MAALAASLPEEILVWEILVRLPAKDILRCRMVCRAWCRLTSAADFLLAHHKRQPSLPLLTLYGTDSTEDGGLPIFERGRPVLGFDDYDDFTIHASCDGLLLLSLLGRGVSICNPATRQWARLRCLDDSGISIAALYLHYPSREYRVLYWKKDKDRNQNYLKAAYYIQMMGSGSSSARCIGVPSDIPRSEQILMAFQNSTAPIVFHNCLHWDPDCFQNNSKIVVFDTVVESFRFMSTPAGATSFDTSLCDMEGSMGFSCSDDERTLAKIWVLEDYETRVWSFKYHVKFPVESLGNLQDRMHMVMSHNGDILIYSNSNGYMFHCDKNGMLLEEFQCDPWSLGFIGHWFKESLVKHNFVLGRESGYALGYASPPSLFHRL
jgi:F-box interacting protein